MKTGQRGGPGTEFAIRLALYGLDQLGQLNTVIKDLRALGEKDIQVKVGVSEKGLSDLKRVVKKAAETGFANAELVPEGGTKRKGTKRQETAAEARRPQPVELPKSVVAALESVGSMTATMTRLSQATVALTKKGEISQAKNPARNSAQAMRVHSESLNRAVGDVHSTLKQILTELKKRPTRPLGNGGGSGGRRIIEEVEEEAPAIRVPVTAAPKSKKKAAASPELAGLKAKLVQLRDNVDKERGEREAVIKAIKEIGTPPNIDGADNSDELEDQVDALARWAQKYQAKVAPHTVGNLKKALSAMAGDQTRLVEWLKGFRTNIIEGLEEAEQAIKKKDAEIHKLEAEIEKARSGVQQAATATPAAPGGKGKKGKTVATPRSRPVSGGVIGVDFDAGAINEAFAGVMTQFPQMMNQAAATFKAAMESIPTTIQVQLTGSGGGEGGGLQGYAVTSERGMTRAEKKAARRTRKGSVALDPFGLVRSLPKSEDAMERVSSDLSAVDGEYTARQNNTGGRSIQQDQAFPPHFSEDPKVRALYKKALGGQELDDDELDTLRAAVQSTRRLQKDAGLFAQQLPSRSAGGNVTPNVLGNIGVENLYGKVAPQAVESVTQLKAAREAEAKATDATTAAIARYDAAIEKVTNKSARRILSNVDAPLKAFMGASYAADDPRAQWLERIVGAEGNKAVNVMSEAAWQMHKSRKEVAEVSGSDEPTPEERARRRALALESIKSYGVDPAAVGRWRLGQQLKERERKRLVAEGATGRIFVKGFSGKALEERIDAELASTGKSAESYANVKSAAQYSARLRASENARTRRIEQQRKERENFRAALRNPALAEAVGMATLSGNIAFPIVERGQVSGRGVGGKLGFGSDETRDILRRATQQAIVEEIDRLNRVVDTSDHPTMKGVLRPDDMPDLEVPESKRQAMDMMKKSNRRLRQLLERVHTPGAFESAAAEEAARRELQKEMIRNERLKMLRAGETPAAVAAMTGSQLVERGETSARNKRKQLEAALQISKSGDGLTRVSVPGADGSLVTSTVLEVPKAVVNKVKAQFDNAMTAVTALESDVLKADRESAQRADTALKREMESIERQFGTKTSKFAERAMALGSTESVTLDEQTRRRVTGIVKTMRDSGKKVTGSAIKAVLVAQAERERAQVTSLAEAARAASKSGNKTLASELTAKRDAAKARLDLTSAAASQFSRQESAAHAQRAKAQLNKELRKAGVRKKDLPEFWRQVADASSSYDAARSQDDATIRKQFLEGLQKNPLAASLLGDVGAFDQYGARELAEMARLSIGDAKGYVEAAQHGSKIFNRRNIGEAPQISMPQYERGEGSNKQRKKLEQLVAQGWNFYEYGDKERAALESRLEYIAREQTENNNKDPQLERDRRRFEAARSRGGEWTFGEFAGWRRMGGLFEETLPDTASLKDRFGGAQAPVLKYDRAKFEKIAAAKAAAAAQVAAADAASSSALAGAATPVAPGEEAHTKRIKDLGKSINDLNSIDLSNLTRQFESLLVPIRATQEALVPTYKALQEVQSAVLKDGLRERDSQRIKDRTSHRVTAEEESWMRKQQVRDASRVAAEERKQARAMRERAVRTRAVLAQPTAAGVLGPPRLQADEVGKLQKGLETALRGVESSQKRLVTANQQELAMRRMGGFTAQEFRQNSRRRRNAAMDMGASEDLFMQFAAQAASAAGSPGAPKYFSEVKKTLTSLLDSQVITAGLKERRAQVGPAAMDLATAQERLRYLKGQDLSAASPAEKARHAADRAAAVDQIVNARAELASNGANLKTVDALNKQIGQRERNERALMGSIAARVSKDKSSISVLDRLTGKLKSLAMYMGAGTLLYGGWSILRQAYTEARTLEAELTRVQGIVEGQRISDRLQIERGVLDSAKEYGVTIREALQITKMFAQSGFDTTDSLKQMRAALLAVQGAGLDPNQATEMLVAVNNVSQGRVGPTEILDRIARVEARAAVTAQDLSVAIQRVGAIATQLQPNMLGDVDALDTVMAATTRIVETTRVSGNQAATSLRFMMSRLAAPDVAKKLQEQYGINLAGRNENEMRPLQDILSDIAAKYQALMGEGKTVEANSLLATFAGARQINAAAALFTNFERFMEIATDAAGAFGDAQSRLALQMETLEFKTRAMQAAFDEMAYSLIKNTGIGDLMKGVMDGMKWAFSGIAGAADSKKGSGVLNMVMGTSVLGGAIAGGSGIVSLLGSLFLGKNGMAQVPDMLSKASPGLQMFLKALGFLAGGPVGMTLKVLLGVLGALAIGKGLKGLFGSGDQSAALSTARNVDLNQIRESSLFQEYATQARDLGLGAQQLSDNISAAFEQAQENAAKRLGLNLSEFRGPGAKTDPRLAYAVEEELLKIVRDGGNPALAQLYTGNDQETTQNLMNLLRNTNIREQAVSSQYMTDLEKRMEEGMAGFRTSQMVGMSGADGAATWAQWKKDQSNPQFRDTWAFIEPIVNGIRQSAGGNLGMDFSNMYLGEGKLVWTEVRNMVLNNTVNRLNKPITNLAMAMDELAHRFLAFSADDLKRVQEAKRKLTAAGKQATDENVLAQLRADGSTETAGRFENRTRMQAIAYAQLAQTYGVESLVKSSLAKTAELRGDTVEGDGALWIKTAIENTMEAQQKLLNDVRAQGQTEQAKRLEAGMAILRNYQNRPDMRAKLPTTEQLSGAVAMRDRLMDIMFKYATTRLEGRRYAQYASGVEVEYAGRRYMGLAGTNMAERNLQASTGALQDLAAVQAELLHDIARTRVRMAQVGGSVVDGTQFAAAFNIVGDEGGAERAALPGSQAIQTVYNQWREENLKPLRQRLTIAEAFYERMMAGDEDILTALPAEDIARLRELGGATSDSELFERQVLSFNAMLKYYQIRAGEDKTHLMKLEEELYITERIAAARQRDLDTMQTMNRITRESAARRAEITGGALSGMFKRVGDLGADRDEAMRSIDRRLEGRIEVLRKRPEYIGAEGSAELERAINRATDDANTERADFDAQWRPQLHELQQNIRDTAFATVWQSTASIIDQANAGLKATLRDWKSVSDGLWALNALDSVASTIQDRLSDVFVDGLVGPNGVFGKQMMELFGSQMLMERETIIAAHVEGILNGFRAVGFSIAPQEGEGSPEERMRQISKKGFTMQAFGMASNLLGGFAGSRINMGKETYGQTGASIGTLVGSKAISQMFGFKAAAALGPWGMVIGGVVGGLLGGLFKRRQPKQTPEYAALERIDRNTRETITAIENQTRDLLSLDNRLLNVPASFVSPRYRPLDAPSARMDGTAPAPNFTFIINDATDPQKVASAVSAQIRKEMDSLGTYTNRRY